MHFPWLLIRKSLLNWIVVVAALVVVAPRSVHAEALLVVEADTGKVLEAQNATYPSYPASVTKLMTAYVTLKAVKEGRISLDTTLTVSPVAASQSPSKMGLRPGTQVTVDNALKMMLVKSANDMAVVLAEGVGGSIDGFSAMMNENAQRLGMTQTSYVNPNGLPADGQVTSARDLAMLARAIIGDVPEYEYFVHIPSIRFGRRVTQNFNKLIGRYPGADGFKTGFICASGYNLVASATRNGKRLIAVVLGASSGQARAVKAAQLLERGFGNNTLSWLRPSLGTVDNLAPIDASPPNLRDEMCGGKRHKPASDEDEDTVASNTGNAGSGEPGLTFFAAGLQPPLLKPSVLMAGAPAPSEPIPVYTGPTRTGPALIAAIAADSDKQTVRRVKKTHLAAKKPRSRPPNPQSPRLLPNLRANPRAPPRSGRRIKRARRPRAKGAGLPRAHPCLFHLQCFRRRAAACHLPPHCSILPKTRSPGSIPPNAITGGISWSAYGSSNIRPGSLPISI
ncbi:MAG: D-alanyl-D-alanine carboxypeptidase [Alphaproteobacteria bacterium]|nr:MAG: D-alanyl-D-alanine carboxypeptidase [Alphaproteobacteria bacterium]